MKRQAIITNIHENMENIKKIIFSKLPNTHKDKPTMSQMGVMMIVQHLPEAGVKEISVFFKISPSATTQLVNGLVRKKLLTRQLDTKDRRKTNLKLTVSGEKILIEMKREQMKFLTQVFRPLSNKELDLMNKLQKKVIFHMKN